MTCSVDPAAQRVDFVVLFDVADGNPNGDPDAGNLPRVDPVTMQGLVSDGAIKRKIRDYVTLTRAGEPGFDIYIQSETALNTLHGWGREQVGLPATGKDLKRDAAGSVISAMCARFFDIRTFGAVMSTGANAGQVRGPVQITWGRSLGSITPLEASITRIAITRPEQMDAYTGDDGKEKGAKHTEMGRKALVPYGLYRAYGFVSPFLAKKTGFGTADLDVLFEALGNAWEHDHSAARGRMSCRGLHVFVHDNPVGRARAENLFDRVTVASSATDPRSFSDYTVSVAREGLPEGVTYQDLGG